ncbi:MAG TPA: NAD-dependent epimerase/dehydratase family protein [Bacteroidales bacterium]|nr:NAD-dependent epimerase/dehydratase family protein [Bacteroidales bacterium]HSA42081.1 NAD-dependent epimerase/dehydratase family protein [Bacteroidales bacterium]
MILLTGATGFLGSYLLLELLQRGYEVRALRRSSSGFDQFERVMQTYADGNPGLKEKVDWVKGDILDIFSLEDAMKGCDTVVHAAGMVSFHRKDRKALIDINVEGTANVVNVALKEKIGRLLYISSIAAFGRGGDDAVITEKTIWKTSRMNSRYAISKYNGEKEVWRGQEEGLPVVVVNPAIIIGYGDPGQGSSRMFSTVKHGLRFYPPGINGFVDVRDVARAVGLLMDKNITGEKYILSAANLRYGELFALIAAELGKKPPSVRVNRFITSLAWQLEALRATLSGEEPLLTRETAQTAANTYLYDGNKICGIEGFQYTSPEETIHHTGALLKRDFGW